MCDKITTIPEIKRGAINTLMQINLNNADRKLIGRVDRGIPTVLFLSSFKGDMIWGIPVIHQNHILF